MNEGDSICFEKQSFLILFLLEHFVVNLKIHFCLNFVSFFNQHYSTQIGLQSKTTKLHLCQLNLHFQSKWIQRFNKQFRFLLNLKHFSSLFLVLEPITITFPNIFWIFTLNFLCLKNQFSILLFENHFIFRT